ncbi:TIGR00269 family protein [Candidatus Woesearchaeota archaeon]|nr:TIGR00269 family protein [Candidatus Woesearchaeota archaeon]
MIAASGGKDSTVILYLLKKLGYNVCALTIDVGIGKYSSANLKRAREFCSEYGIKLYETSLRKEFGYSLCYIQEILKSKKAAFQSCMVCGVLRRNLLNKLARRIKATKVVTGHNLDDEAQTILMNIFRNSLKLGARLGPITGQIRDKKFIPRVKPLYFVSEKEVADFSKKMKFDVVYTRCPCAADSLRDTLRALLNEYEKKHPGTKKKIVENFISKLPLFKKYFKTDLKLKHCKSCGEPSLYEVCNSCKLIGMLK